MATWAGPPRSYSSGRNRPIQYVVIHTTEGSEGSLSAEAGVAYDKRRTDGVSTHLFVDADSALMEVRYSDRAHAARFHGNEVGIQIELCGTARQTPAQWHDAASLAMLRLAAVEVAAICRLYSIPPVRLTVAQVRAAYYGPTKPKGICGHADVTKAYPEDGGDHTDPGANFPWSEFLSMVKAEMEDDMTPEQDKMLKAINERVAALALGRPTVYTKWAANPAAVEQQWTVARLTELQFRPAVVASPVDGEALKAAVRDVLLEPAVRDAYAEAIAANLAKRVAE